MINNIVFFLFKLSHKQAIIEYQGYLKQYFSYIVAALSIGEVSTPLRR